MPKSKMGKTVCKNQLLATDNDAKFKCKKCDARVLKKKNVCKPKKIKKEHERIKKQYKIICS